MTAAMIFFTPLLLWWQLTHPRRHSFSRQACHVFHHLFGLLKLLQKAIHLGDAHSAARGDAATAAAVDDRRIVALLARHRVDDRFGAFELGLGGRHVHAL